MDRELEKALRTLGVSDALASGLGKADKVDRPLITVRSPIDGSTLAEFASSSMDDVKRAIGAAVHDFHAWRDTPAPVRGEFVRRIGNKLREKQEQLATIVAW